MQLVNTEVKKYDMISVPVLAGGTTTVFNFPDQPQLRGVKVYGIDLVYNTTDFYNQENKNFTSSIIANGFLTLYFEGRNGIQNMPLREISHITNVGVVGAQTNSNINGILGLNGQIITWTKSYISFPTAPSVGVTNGVFVIGVYYSL